jgi:hypothetical protein
MKYYKAKGVRKPLSKWAALAGISRQAMAKRVSLAKTPEELEVALTSPDFQGRAAKFVVKEAMAVKEETQADLFGDE